MDYLKNDLESFEKDKVYDVMSKIDRKDFLPEKIVNLAYIN